MDNPISHFYGTLHGSRGQATRCGTEASGMDACIGSCEGGANAHLSHCLSDPNHLVLSVTPWQSVGQTIVCYSGPAAGAFDVWVKEPSSAWEKVECCISRGSAESIISDDWTGVPAVIVPAGCFFQGF